MKTKTPYILAGNYENAINAIRVLEQQNIAYILDDRYAGNMINQTLPIIGLKEAISLSETHTIVDISPGGGGEDTLPFYESLK